MFSTSSSEYNFSGPYQFGTTFPNILGNPFCSTARQPLIYYAKVEEPLHRQQNGGKKKNKSNYFMKAFRWYTQEHGSCLNNEIPNSQVNNGFAAWLDKKYSEYIKGSHQEGSDLIPKQLSTIEDDAIPKVKKSRKFGRKRSPWNKSHELCDKEKNVAPHISPHLSFQYILQPQDLSRTASECCQRTSRIQSTTTIMSKDSAKCTKVKVKSTSLLSIYRAPRERENKEVKPKLNAKNVLCACIKKDAGTQYETYSLETVTSPRHCKRNRELENTNATDVDTNKIYLTSVPCQCDEQNMTMNAYKPSHNTQNVQYEHHIKERQKGTSPKDMFTDETSKLPKAAVMFTENTNVNSELQNLSVQTSDHSINLDDMMYQQPIFLKIVHVNQ